MNELPAERSSNDGRGSESRQPARAASSSSSDLRPPPSSGPISGADLPPPPAQLVAALAEFETSGPGPESFRRSVPDFTPADAPIGAPDSRPKTAEAKGETAKAPARPAPAPSSSIKLVGIIVGVVCIAVALWALFLR
jgi:hypothetical protein